MHSQSIKVFLVLQMIAGFGLGALMAFLSIASLAITNKTTDLLGILLFVLIGSLAVGSAVVSITYINKSFDVRYIWFFAVVHALFNSAAIALGYIVNNDDGSPVTFLCGAALAYCFYFLWATYAIKTESRNSVPFYIQIGFTVAGFVSFVYSVLA